MISSSSLLRAFFTAVIVFSLSACQSSREELQLQNVEQFKAARRAERRKIEETARRCAEKDNRPLSEVIQQSRMTPPELAFLSFSKAFRKVKAAEKKQFESQASNRKYFPGFLPLWRAQSADVWVMAGVTPSNRAQMTARTRSEFDRGTTGALNRYEDFYRETRGSSASFKSRDYGPVVICEIKSKYLENGRWRTDERLTYFYSPDYRLNFLITGEDEALEELKPDLWASFGLFEKKLAEYFPEGITFAKTSSKPDQAPAPAGAS